MKYIRIILVLSFATGLLIAETENNDACLTCHLEVDEDLDVPVMSNYENDIHIQSGLSCSDCHGGDPTAIDDSDAAMWDDDSFIGIIEKIDQPKICGTCHSSSTYMRNYSTSSRTDQVDQFWTSRHGILLKNGDTKVASCTSCHGAHGIFPIDHPRSKVYATQVPSTCAACHSDSDYMEEYDIPTDQFDSFKESVHGVALLDKQDNYSPACNDCHGNHGAIPPNVSHISDICGSCHINNKDLFQGSFHREYFIENDFNECEACHGNHEVVIPSDDMLAWDDNSVCMKCHDKDDIDAEKMSLNFYQTIDSLNTELHAIEEQIAIAETKGMEVSELFIHLEDAQRALIQTRTNIHGFDIDYVSETAESGFSAVATAKIGVTQILNELIYRKKGLIIFSIIITFTILVLYLKLKSMQHTQSKREKNKSK